MGQESGYMTEGCWPTARLLAWVQGAKAALRREGGQTLLEYALIVGFIGIATIATLMLLAPAIVPAFQAVTDVIEEYVPL
jgi:Flp pilus assembly pilin Flp